MKRTLILFSLLFIIASASFAQVINYGKTLPNRAKSLTITPAINGRTSVYHEETRGPAILVTGGTSLQYDMDLSLKYGYYTGEFTSVHLFAAELQYMFRETRRNYYSIHAGIHKWKEYGVDGAFTFTYTPQYNVNLSSGLDLDIDISQLEFRAWIPLNFGLNFDDRYFVFIEYDLPMTETAWDILNLGVNFIFR